MSKVDTKMMKTCAECEIQMTYGIEKHHAFGAANRKISEKYKMVEDFCPSCHRGNNGIHFNKEMMLRYKQKHQRIFEETIGTRDDFIRIFGRNYLD